MSGSRSDLVEDRFRIPSADRILLDSFNDFLKLCHPFNERTYGFEVLLYLYVYDDSSLGIDELWMMIRNGRPHREAFGRFINRLKDAGVIVVEPDPANRRKKLVRLDQELFCELGGFMFDKVTAEEL